MSDDLIPFGYADGGYTCECHRCRKEFTGDKRAITCKGCAEILLKESTPIIVTMRHVRSAKLCSRGTRAWFEKHGLDFNVFLTKGYPVETIEGTGDALGQIVADEARKEVS